MKILLVDDSKAIHALIRDLMSKKSYSLDEAYNGKECLAKLESNKYDLILLDWEMPVMTGPETFAELKKKGISIPVVMMTSRNSMEDIDKMITAGVAEYIIKPFTEDIVFEKIGMALGATG